jgi:hypothetical protein
VQRTDLAHSSHHRIVGLHNLIGQQAVHARNSDGVKYGRQVNPDRHALAQFDVEQFALAFRQTLKHSIAQMHQPSRPARRFGHYGVVVAPLGVDFVGEAANRATPEGAAIAIAIRSGTQHIRRCVVLGLGDVRGLDCRIAVVGLVHHSFPS